MFPRDTDHRRNIGYLMAWRDGADIMISVDDDNLAASSGSGSMPLFASRVAGT